MSRSTTRWWRSLAMLPRRSPYNVRPVASKQDLERVVHIQRCNYPEELWEDEKAFAQLADAFPRGAFLLERRPLSLPLSAAAPALSSICGYLFCFPWRLNAVHELFEPIALDGKEDCLYIHDLAISPDAQGRGGSSVLLGAANALSRELGLSQQALVAIHSGRARQFWTRLGFADGREMTYGKTVKATYMTRPTPSAASSSSRIEGRPESVSPLPSPSALGATCDGERTDGKEEGEWTRTPATEAMRALGLTDYTERSFEYVPKGGTARSSSRLGVDEHSVVKTLVFQDARPAKGEKPALFIILDRQVDSKLMAAAAGFRKVSACSVPTAEAATGYQVGGTSPFGTRTKLLLFMEETIASLPRMHCNGGRRGFLVSMHPSELIRALKPTLVRVAAASTPRAN